MKDDYLPEWATGAEASAWLEAKTGEKWPEVRLLETHIECRFWLDPRPEDLANPEVMARVFGGRQEGFRAPVSRIDRARLITDRTAALTETRTASGEPVFLTRTTYYGLEELRYPRMGVKKLAAAKGPPAAPAADDAPTPLPTRGIALCFDGLYRPAEVWLRLLGKKPKWLKHCAIDPGQRGSPARWNPVLIGAALVRRGDIERHKVRSRFQTKPPLIPWLSAWDSYAAEYLDED